MRSDQPRGPARGPGVGLTDRTDPLFSKPFSRELAAKADLAENPNPWHSLGDSAYDRLVSDAEW